MKPFLNSCEVRLSRLSALAAVVFALASIQLFAQPAQREVEQAQLVQSRQLLEQLTRIYGRLDPRLLELLQQLGKVLSELGEHGDANEVLGHHCIVQRCPRIKSIRFRPKLVDGVAQAVSAKLFYDTFQ